MNAANARLFGQADVAGVFFLGGDQTVAMQVIAGTPVEKAMRAAFERGAVFSGTSAGDSVESRNMVAGFVDNKGPEQEFRRAAVQVWWGSSNDHRGLAFGARGVLFDQHFYQRGRFGRLINMVAQSADHLQSQGLLGVGIDFGTGLVDANGSMLKHVFGASSAAVVDFGTADTSYRWTGQHKILSARSILTDILAPDPQLTYSIKERTPRLDGHAVAFHRPPEWSQCLFGMPGRGKLILGGDGTVHRQPGEPFNIFVNSLADAHVSRVVLIIAGFAKASEASAAAAQFRHSLRAAGWQRKIEVQKLPLDAHRLQHASEAGIQSAGFILAAHDASILARQIQKKPLRDYLRKIVTDGSVVFTVGAMTAVVGDEFAAVPASNSKDLEDVAIAAFNAGGVVVDSGLRVFRRVNFVPGLLESRRWGDLYSLAKADQNAITFGLSNQSAIVVGADPSTSASQCASVREVGLHPAVAVDGRAAMFRPGTNGAYSALNVLMDVFAPGDEISGERDD